MTNSVQDYLKTIYAAEQSGERITTSSLASALGVRPASVSGMLKKLREGKLVKTSGDKQVTLTPRGRKSALTVIRRHRLIELFLVQVLDLSWDEVHQEAEQLEHVLSDRLEQRIDDYLGNPEFDPHGAPIPTREGTVKSMETVLLSAVATGETVFVAVVLDKNPELLRYLDEVGLRPGSEVTIRNQAPFEGPLTIEVNGVVYHIGRQAASAVSVRHPETL